MKNSNFKLKNCQQQFFKKKLLAKNKIFAFLRGIKPYRKSAGFILIYTVIIAGVIAIIIGVTFNSVLGELRISIDESESLKAFYAADSGIECVRFLQNNFQAFDTTTEENVYNCGVGDNFTAGFSPPTEECVAHIYNFTLDGFSNGSCANVEVTVTPRTIIVEGNPVDVCDLRVISTGRNSCSALGSKLVERTRWEDM
jgi:Tfp pilus assembly protein PilX